MALENVFLIAIRLNACGMSDELKISSYKSLVVYGFFIILYVLYDRIAVYIQNSTQKIIHTAEAGIVHIDL